MDTRLSVVVKEGAFVIFSLLGMAAGICPISGTAIVRLVLDPDGSYRLRLSDCSIVNPKQLPLRLMCFRAGPDGAARKPKSNFVDVFGEPIWLDGAPNGRFHRV